MWALSPMQESNLHARRHLILSEARLPVTPIGDDLPTYPSGRLGSTQGHLSVGRNLCPVFAQFRKLAHRRRIPMRLSGGWPDFEASVGTRL